MKLTLKEIIEATGAKILKNEGVSGKFALSTDTRTIKKGEIYLPLKGENFDGENFIDKALDAEAIGYFCTKVKKIASVENLNPKRQQKSRNDVFQKAKIVLEVKDTLIAYLELAGFFKWKNAPKFFAIK